MNKISIFICAHQPFDDSVFPANDMYKIVTYNRNMKSDNHEVIYFDTVKGRLLSEINHLLWIYHNIDNIDADYICVCHYRRFLKTYMNNENKLIEDIDKHKFVTSTSWPLIKDKTVLDNLRRHFYDYCVDDVFLPSLNEVSNKHAYLKQHISEMLESDFRIYNNIFACAKEDYIEIMKVVEDFSNVMCEKMNIHSDEEMDENIRRNIVPQNCRRFVAHMSEVVVQLYLGHYNKTTHYENLLKLCDD